MAIDKKRSALSALQNHSRRYKVEVPKKLKDLYASDFMQHHLKWAKNDGIAGYGGDTFQLAITPPTWLGKGDDAINGPRGEWEDAKFFVPIFVTDQSLYVVVDLRTPACKVGWYQEETFDDGVHEEEKSLDSFLKSLVKTIPEAETTDAFKPADPDQEMDWEEDFEDDGPRAFDKADDEEDD
jgi:hypothetical protein